MQNPYQSPQFGSPNRLLGGEDGASFRVTCECGTQTAVKASQAGGKVACRCGRMLSVPRLSQLRIASGQPAHETNVRDTISRMIEAGDLPWGNSCAVTEMLTDDVVWLEVICEASYTERDGRVSWLMALGALMIPGGLLALALRGKETERHGRDIVVCLPLRVSREKHKGLNRSTQRYLRRLLSTVPIYEELFRTHPAARVVVSRPATARV